MEAISIDFDIPSFHNQEGEKNQEQDLFDSPSIYPSEFPSPPLELRQCPSSMLSYSPLMTDLLSEQNGYSLEDSAFATVRTASTKYGLPHIDGVSIRNTVPIQSCSSIQSLEDPAPLPSIQQLLACISSTPRQTNTTIHLSSPLPNNSVEILEHGTIQQTCSTMPSNSSGPNNGLETIAAELEHIPSPIVCKDEQWSFVSDAPFIQRKRGKKPGSENRIRHPFTKDAPQETELFHHKMKEHPYIESIFQSDKTGHPVFATEDEKIGVNTSVAYLSQKKTTAKQNYIYIKLRQHENAKMDGKEIERAGTHSITASEFVKVISFTTPEVLIEKDNAKKEISLVELKCVEKQPKDEYVICYFKWGDEKNIPTEGHYVPITLHDSKNNLTITGYYQIFSRKPKSTTGKPAREKPKNENLTTAK